MATFKANTGLPPAFNGNSGTQQPSGLWRPWEEREESTSVDRARSFQPDQSFTTQPKISPFVHPVRLFWPKSKCFDYLYQDSEMLLRTFPVQATICLYDSSSDEDNDEEEEETKKEPK